MTDKQEKIIAVIESLEFKLKESDVIKAELKRVKKEYSETNLTLSRLKAIAVANVTGWQQRSSQGFHGFSPKGCLHPYKRQSEMTALFPTKKSVEKLQQMLSYMRSQLT